MGIKADLIKAMPVGSKWNGSCKLGDNLKDMGERTVACHRSTYMQFSKPDGGHSRLDYPKQNRDRIEIKEDQVIVYCVDVDVVSKTQKVWSTVIYDRIK